MTRLTRQPHPLTHQQAETITQQHIEQMRESGDLDRAAKRLSMAYLLFTCAQDYAESATDLLEKYDLVHKKVKTTTNNLMQSFNAYNNVMSSMLNGDHGALKQLCFDSTMFTDIMNALMTVPNLISLLLLSGVMARDTQHYLWNKNLDEEEKERN
jgi:hypothetical protein